MRCLFGFVLTGGTTKLTLSLVTARLPANHAKRLNVADPMTPQDD
jgi:hypothetical protein